MYADLTRYRTRSGISSAFFTCSHEFCWYYKLQGSFEAYLVAPTFLCCKATVRLGRRPVGGSGVQGPSKRTCNFCPPARSWEIYWWSIMGMVKHRTQSKNQPLQNFYADWGTFKAWFHNCSKSGDNRHNLQFLVGDDHLLDGSLFRNQICTPWFFPKVPVVLAFTTRALTTCKLHILVVSHESCCKSALQSHLVKFEGASRECAPLDKLLHSEQTSRGPEKEDSGGQCTLLGERWSRKQCLPSWLCSQLSCLWTHVSTCFP